MIPRFELLTIGKTLQALHVALGLRTRTANRTYVRFVATGSSSCWLQDTGRPFGMYSALECLTKRNIPLQDGNVTEHPDFFDRAVVQGDKQGRGNDTSFLIFVVSRTTFSGKLGRRYWLHHNNCEIYDIAGRWCIQLDLFHGCSSTKNCYGYRGVHCGKRFVMRYISLLAGRYIFSSIPLFSS